MIVAARRLRARRLVQSLFGLPNYQADIVGRLGIPEEENKYGCADYDLETSLRTDEPLGKQGQISLCHVARRRSLPAALHSRISPCFSHCLLLLLVLLTPLVCAPLPSVSAVVVIALVARGGGCSFGVKALNAQKAGARAIVVYTTETGTQYPLPKMSGGDDTFSINIPGMLINYQSQ